MTDNLYNKYISITSHVFNWLKVLGKQKKSPPKLTDLLLEKLIKIRVNGDELYEELNLINL